MERDLSNELPLRPASVPLYVYSQLADELNALRQENRELREQHRQLLREKELLEEKINAPHKATPESEFRRPKVAMTPDLSRSWLSGLTPNKL
jgi:hypothetical protein